MTHKIDFSEIAELKNFKILGYTTDFNQCDCCGKEDLKGTIAILDLNTDVVVHYGSTCAANANKYDTLEALAKAKKEINSAVREYNRIKHEARCFAWNYIRSVYGKQANSDNISKDIWEPIVEDFEKWYTTPANRFKSHPLFPKR